MTDRKLDEWIANLELDVWQAQIEASNARHASRYPADPGEEELNGDVVMAEMVADHKRAYDEAAAEAAEKAARHPITTGDDVTSLLDELLDI